MGCINSKELNDKKRRRLSVLNASGKEASAETTNEANTGSLLELLPPGQKRFSLVGLQAGQTVQREFENKRQSVAVSGLEKLNTCEFGIGYGWDSKLGILQNSNFPALGEALAQQN